MRQVLSVVPSEYLVSLRLGFSRFHVPVRTNIIVAQSILRGIVVKMYGIHIIEDIKILHVELELDAR